MKRVVSVSLGEIVLKGKNRKYFEDQLVSRMRRAMKGLSYERIYKEQGKIYIELEKDSEDQIIEALKKVFGLIYISPCYRVDKDLESIKEAVDRVLSEKISQSRPETFKVKTNRSDKNFPIKSPEISREIGAHVLRNFQPISVDVHDPEIYVYVDIKDNAYVYIDRYEGYGGLPIGTNGKGLLLLSGGIDSPVAGFMMAKRGVEVSAIHYHSYPFTSERAEAKVKELAKIMSFYTGKIKLYSVNILEIQKSINKLCPEDEMTIHSRRFMMMIAEKIARANNVDALITGENLGQVASQTIKGINATNNSVDIPVLRPLIGFDKVDIIEIARNIGTYETSILPFDDCCTLFLPKHPVTRPRVEDIKRSEEALDLDSLINAAIENMEVTYIG